MRKKEIALLASAAAVAYSLTLLLQAPFQACSGAAAGYYAAGAPETGIEQGKIHETIMPGTPSPACPPTMTTSYTIEATTVANDEADTVPSSIAEGEVSREKETVPPNTEAPKETVPSTETSTTVPKNDKPSGGGKHNDRPVPTPTVSHPTNPSPSKHSVENKVAAAEVVTGNDQAHIHVNSKASASRATKTDDTSQMNRNAVAALILLSAFVCYLAYLKSCPRD